MFKVSHQFIFRFLLFGQSDQKRKNQLSCLFTHYYSFVNKGKISQLKLVLRSWRKRIADFFVFCHFDQITKNDLMRYIWHKSRDKRLKNSNHIVTTFSWGRGAHTTWIPMSMLWRIDQPGLWQSSKLYLRHRKHLVINNSIILIVKHHF